MFLITPLKVGIDLLEMFKTTFINLHYMAAGFINGDISQIYMEIILFIVTIMRIKM